MKKFDSLSEQEILALAISLEEEDERVYADFAEGLRDSFPDFGGAVFDAMRADETGHRQRLLSLYRERFGDHIPLIRRQDVQRFRPSHACMAGAPAGVGQRCVSRPARSKSRRVVSTRELPCERTDVSIRELLDDLAQEERESRTSWHKRLLRRT